MLRMEIALVLVLGFVAYMYDSAERTRTALHRTFSALLAATLVHLVFDALTLYTVNHLDTVPRLLNDALHRVFVGTMVLVVFLFYQYIAILVEEETGKPRRLDLAACIFLAAAVARRAECGLRTSGGGRGTARSGEPDFDRSGAGCVDYRERNCRRAQPDAAGSVKRKEK